MPKQGEKRKLILKVAIILQNRLSQKILSNPLIVSFPFCRYIRPSFEFWSTVRKAYDGDEDSEDEYEGDEELEDGRHGVSLEQVDSVGGCGLDGDQNPESESEDEDADLGCSLNKMSITPKDTTLKHGLPGNLGPPARMPARIRPSTSPIWPDAPPPPLYTSFRVPRKAVSGKRCCIELIC